MRDHTYEIALTMLPGVGCSSARQLLDIVESAEALFNMNRSELKNLFGNHEEIVSVILNKSMFKDVENELKFIEKNKIKVLYFTEPEFPQRLNRSECTDAPILLYALGNSDMNPERSVSIVGTRKATDRGRDITRHLVDGLRGEGITVVSGLALGIDSESHEGALSNSLQTIGVLAHGLDRIYPASNRNLAKRMLASEGALVTEMRSGTAITPGLFPARNRIIAALSDATIVVEASKKGGALITANIASGYHRDLFAFPGRVDDKYSEGCNGIIAACKAILIRDADDIFLNMGWERKTKKIGKQTTLFPKIEGDEAVIYNVLKEHPEISMEEIRDFCSLSLPKIATGLLSLELKNLCRCLPGKIYKPL
ncbi:MAG: DNA-processing protein DprA [Bacteroidales bacterium]|nr:DNA-processing protein DprA [Bacteroidales bacterium]